MEHRSFPNPQARHYLKKQKKSRERLGTGLGPDTATMNSRSAASSTTTMALWMVAVVVAVIFLRTAKGLLIPIALAVLISYALEPVVAWLERHRIPRMAGAALVMVTLLGAAGAGGYALRDDATELVQAVPSMLDRAREAVLLPLGSTADAAEQAVGTSGEATGSLVQRAVSAAFAFAGHLVVVFFLIFFLLISGHHVRDRIIEIAGRNAGLRETTATILDDINAQIQRYLMVLLFTAMVVAAATWLVLASMQVPHAAMWGILAGVFNSIPYFGPVVVSGGLFAVGLMQGGGMTQALQMAGAAMVITSLEGWLLTPALMGKAERMSALAVFLGLLLWTWVWGAWGTILAVPMLVIVKSVADHVERLKPVGRLMAP
jgi:predicted PurR-regulated permease PerM